MISAVCFREQVEDLQKEIQKIEADYRRQVVEITGTIQVLKNSSLRVLFTKGNGIQWSVDLTEELNCWNML